MQRAPRGQATCRDTEAKPLATQAPRLTLQRRGSPKGQPSLHRRAHGRVIPCRDAAARGNPRLRSCISSNNGGIGDQQQPVVGDRVSSACERWRLGFLWRSDVRQQDSNLPAPIARNCSSQPGLALAPLESAEECRAAVGQVGGVSMFPKAQSKSHYQSGCSKCGAGCSAWDLGVLFFNERANARPNPNHHTVCREM